MNPKLLLTGVIGLGLIFQPEARAQQQPTPRNPGQSETQTRPSTPPGAERSTSQMPSQSADAMTTESFVKKVAGDNQMEIDMARTASSRAKSPQVKDFAQQLIKDHTNSLDALKKYASRHNVSLPTGSTASSSSTNQNTQSNRNDPADRNSQPQAMARTDDANSRELASKTGAEFDQAYIHLMVQNHRKGVALFEKQKEAKGMDSEIQAFVNNTLPVLRTHLSRAESIEKAVGSATIDARPTTNPSNTNPSKTRQ